MTFTFNQNLSTNVDKVRFKIGDTDSADPQLTDELITVLLSDRSSNVNKAAEDAVRGLIAKFSRDVDSSVGPISESASQRVAQYKALLSHLQSSRSASLGVVATGLTRSDLESGRQDEDRIPPAFRLDTQEIYNTGDSEYESF